MGKMKELAYEREQFDQEIAFARMEAEYEALPKSHAESLDIVKNLRAQLGSLVASFEKVNSRKERNKERAIGFVLGVAASIVAALILLTAASRWPIFKG